MKLNPTYSWIVLVALFTAGCGSETGEVHSDTVTRYMVSETDLALLECDCYWDEVIFEEPLYDSLESCLDDVADSTEATESCLTDAPEELHAEISAVLNCADAVNRDALARFQPLGCDLDSVSEEEEAAFEARWTACDTLAGADAQLHLSRCQGVSISCNAEGECVECAAGVCTPVTLGD